MRTVVIFMTIDIKFLLQIEIFFLCILGKREFSCNNMTISSRIYYRMVIMIHVILEYVKLMITFLYFYIIKGLLNLFYNYCRKKFYAIVFWCTQHVLWLKLDGIKFRTRNLSSKVTPSDIIRESFFSSFLNHLGTICTMCIWAWKWGSVVM